jgi:hypothetical protein
MNPTGQGGALYPGGPGLPGGNATGSALNNTAAMIAGGELAGPAAAGGGAATGGDVAGSLADSGSALPAYGAPIGSVADYMNSPGLTPGGVTLGAYGSYGSPTPSAAAPSASPAGASPQGQPAQLAPGGPSNAQQPSSLNTSLAAGGQAGQIYLQYLAESKLKAQPDPTAYAPPHSSAPGQTSGLSLAPGGGFAIPSQY